MKGAVILTNDRKFLEWAGPALSKANYNVSTAEDLLQLTENERLLTVYGMSPLSEFAHEVEEELLQQLTGEYYGCLADCRWEDLFCRVMKDLAANSQSKFWILDNSGAVLNPAELDPATIHL